MTLSTHRLGDEGPHGGADVGPRDFVLRGRLRDGLLRQVVEHDDALHPACV